MIRMIVLPVLVAAALVFATANSAEAAPSVVPPVTPAMGWGFGVGVSVPVHIHHHRPRPVTTMIPIYQTVWTGYYNAFGQPVYQTVIVGYQPVVQLVYPRSYGTVNVGFGWRR